MVTWQDLIVQDPELATAAGALLVAGHAVLREDDVVLRAAATAACPFVPPRRTTCWSSCCWIG